jgi:hypothetical protein
MKHLKATDVKYKDRLISVELNETKNLFPLEQEKKWVDALFKSISEKGMKHPILVCSEKTLKEHLHTLIRVPIEYSYQKWYVVVGNNRYIYAKQNSYKSIDAYELKSLDDYELFHNSTVLEAHQF